MKTTKEYLTTSEVASLFSVSPDTALRWARSGKIPALRTPGGHFRIHRSRLLSIISEKLTQMNKEDSSLQYCWEFHSKSGQNRQECENCAVFRVKAIRCYEMLKLSDDIGHAKIFCTSCCSECDYYKTVHSHG